MKKSTKILAATLAVLPCALMLTACGNKTQPLLEGYHEASYTETTYEEFNQEISSRGEAELVGLKARTKLNAT